MRNTTKRAYILFALIAAFFGGLVFMAVSFALNADTWASSRLNEHIYKYRQLATAGTIYDRNGKVLVQTKDGERIYAEDYTVRLSTLHVVGDSQGFISTGVQTVYRPHLIGYNFVDGVYSAVKKGKGNDLALTIDSAVSAAAYEALGGNKGTIAVYNYKTGAVLCEVSAPTFDPENKPDDIDTDTSGKYDGIYLNRFLSGVFTPGSTFKVVTAICAIENMPDIYKKTFNCTGKYKCGKNQYVICNGVHGKLNFERALNVSCNSVFAYLAVKLGADNLSKTAKQLGFGSSVKVSGAYTAKSYIDLSKTAKIDLGWAGIGQYTTLANPCHMLMLAGAIANGGQAVIPYVVETQTTLLPKTGATVNKNITLSAETANKMKKLLRSNVENYYGDNRFPGLKMCGKTGSAEVEGKKSHAWFYGFSADSSFPYAIVVCLENGGIGYNDAVPAANKVLQALKNS